MSDDAGILASLCMPNRQLCKHDRAKHCITSCLALRTLLGMHTISNVCLCVCVCVCVCVGVCTKLCAAKKSTEPIDLHAMIKRLSNQCMTTAYLVSVDYKLAHIDLYLRRLRVGQLQHQQLCHSRSVDMPVPTL